MSGTKTASNAELIAKIDELESFVGAEVREMRNMVTEMMQTVGFVSGRVEEQSKRIDDLRRHVPTVVGVHPKGAEPAE
ncbi:hypothetical protein MTBPR1_80180 [Candidatus Terasakiella magnetica]|uniref:Uncharacterized protein n=1 Tax=Candidatus Terasakiella magnetica TaxID=1867952 RepID=A0A1C3RLG8_9PROT|nr:hypothetical protein [Candidatus Terasakiella magnetica]SCA58126.1 hypothetical protein MTBPR1_80180 [Candidatus Terasakiella magnetica]